MMRGIIYVMTTVVPGLIKIGKTELIILNQECIILKGTDIQMLSV